MQLAGGAIDAQADLRTFLLAAIGVLVVATVLFVYLFCRFAWTRKWVTRIAPAGLFLVLLAVLVLYRDPSALCLKELLDQPRDAYPVGNESASLWPPGEVSCAYRTGGEVVTVTLANGFWDYVAAAALASLFTFALYGSFVILDEVRKKVGRRHFSG